MRTILLALFALLVSGGVRGQETFDLSFKKAEDNVYNILPNKETIVQLDIIGKNIEAFAKDNYNLLIEIDDETKKTLKGVQYELNFIKKSFSDIVKIDDNDIKYEKLYVVIKTDSLLKVEQKLSFNLVVKDNKGNITTKNTGNYKKITLHLTSNSENTNIQKYKYLSYIGTNFDLVEGIKAENLFFATNIFSEPTLKKGMNDIGFYLSIYGNRTISTRDIQEESIFTEIVPVTENYSYRLNKTVETTRTKHSDNLGAHFSTLHPVFGTRSKNRNVKTYFTISADFVWKRLQATTEYGDVIRIDTLSTASTGHHIILDPLKNSTVATNQYTFNFGSGLFFSIENKDISVRIHGAIGYTQSYFANPKRDEEIFTESKQDIFFAGRAWITEPKTGITLQAEIMNRFIKPNPYYVVTLSKAFQLDRLGGFFSPLTSR